ncbi:MAG: hypothetical protein AAGJ11_17565, partial [Bacteroidota bacterium]
MRSALTLLAALSTLTLTACDSGGPGPDPGPDPIDMAVTEYLTGLPDWDAFAPDVPEQPPTPTGPPVAEDPVTLDVTTLDDDGNE